MPVLVTYGSTRGGTEGLAQMLAEGLRAEALSVEVASASKVTSTQGYEAVVVGGALYAARWHRHSRRFVKRHARELRHKPTYFFSSGPLDSSASEREIAPVRGVQALMAVVGARGHATFGGRLAPDAEGFAASAMAKRNAGDWRDQDQVRAWAHRLATELSPGPASASGS
ncbi:MAG TPA: flavodoxin domain-containing protein [Acidimicrobiales bacterium]|nr:flavodoxin domain-containing protein [Acidimicrobiales bacterium]